MRKPFASTLAAILAIVALAVATPASAKPAKPLFASREMIHLTIKAPVGMLAKVPEKDEKPIAGTLSVVGANPETLPITLAARGITRRRHDVCPFPPLRVEFPDKPPAGSLFQGQKKLKLVTHCQPATNFQQYLLLEYAAYRLYNVLTPASFAVRLAMIDYVNADGRAITSRLGFFIEAAGDVAKRNDLHEFETQSAVPSAQINPHDAARFAVFQYMIGNLDWSMTAGPSGSDCCHNARLFGAAGAPGNLIPVPYDFDYSGLVDAPYAVPPASVNLNSVRTRYYNGFCRTKSVVPAVAAEFTGQRAALLAVFDAIPQLDDGKRRKATDYLNGFFDQIATPANIDGKVLKTCG